MYGIHQTAWAQQDTSRHAAGEQPLLSTTVRESVEKIREMNLDSLFPVKKNRLDSMKAALSIPPDLLGNSRPVRGKADSLNSILSVQDSLNHRLNRYSGKVRSLEDSVRRKIALDNKMDDGRDLLQRKTDSLSEIIDKPLLEVQKKIDEKLNDVTHGNVPKIPGADKINIPQGNEAMPFSTPDISAPGQLDINNTLRQKDIPELPSMEANDKLPEMKVPEVKLPQMDQVKDVSNSMESVDGKLSEAEKAEGELRKAKEEGPGELKDFPRQS